VEFFCFWFILKKANFLRKLPFD